MVVRCEVSRLPLGSKSIPGAARRAQRQPDAPRGSRPRTDATSHARGSQQMQTARRRPRKCAPARARVAPSLYAPPSRASLREPSSQYSRTSDTCSNHGGGGGFFRPGSGSAVAGGGRAPVCATGVSRRGVNATTQTAGGTRAAAPLPLLGFNINSLIQKSSTRLPLGSGLLGSDKINPQWNRARTALPRS